MEYNERYFKHVDNCECNIEKITETMEAAISRHAPYEVDKDGNKLFYVDSFGYRGPIPGETNDCYQAMSEARKNANKIPEGCTCFYAGGGIDILAYDCPLHGQEATEMYGPESQNKFL